MDPECPNRAPRAAMALAMIAMCVASSPSPSNHRRHSAAKRLCVCIVRNAMP